MRKTSWILAALTACGLLHGAALAQEAKPMPAPAAAPVMTAPVIIGGGCCDSGCCDTCCSRGGPIFDIGFMILTPKWKDDPAIFFGDQTNTPETFRQQDFSFHNQFVPQIALGYMGQGGLGVRIGWWGFAVGARESATLTNETGNTTFYAASPLQIQELSGQRVGMRNADKTLFTEAHLRMDVWDFEAVQSLGSGVWSGLLSGGIRYAHVSQTYNALTVFPDSTLNAAILSGHNFNGAGPTLSLEARRGIGETGLYLYGKTRGSLLFGTAKQAGSIISFNTDNAAGDLLDASTRSNSFVPEGELELGIGFQRQIRRGGLMFLQVGVVAQAWGNIGNASESAGSPDETFNNEQSSINRESTLGLIGVTAKAGLNW
ncbi:hypothetical protein AYO44_10790 [Planctomycetaceae bacterium SCGC AG-212-F19]|nr:hypothetical protein AYO44_10790 [Planctomycetaceae bacterium SCGC AG-212-F19]